jgi:NarL family two-component system response regulator LiaR
MGVTTKILLADDHRLVLTGIRSALAGEEDIEIVGEASGGTEVLPLINRLHPDVALLDIRMPGMDGLALLELIKKRFPDVKVVVLSVYTDAEHIEAVLSRGASGYIVKSINPRDLAAAIRQAVNGTVFNTIGMPAPGATSTASTGLTERELMILRAVARGMSNRAIGRELWVTEQTVKFHLTNIYRKLAVANRTEAARAAYRLGIAESPVIDAS